MPGQVPGRTLEPAAGEPVAEHAIALIFACARKIPQSRKTLEASSAKQQWNFTGIFPLYRMDGNWNDASPSGNNGTSLGAGFSPDAVLGSQSGSFGYGDMQVLWDVDLEVKTGEIVTVLGANGAGKTTILRNVSRLVRPNAGTITLDGVELNRLQSHQVVERGVVCAGAAVLHDRTAATSRSITRRESRIGLLLSPGDRNDDLDHTSPSVPIHVRRRPDAAVPHLIHCKGAVSVPCGPLARECTGRHNGRLTTGDLRFYALAPHSHVH